MMIKKEKISQLRNIIIKNLANEIGEKVILLDCPYHGNVGDLLIWEGESEFFKITNKKLISQHSLFTYDFPDISSDVTICLHGGGNFGDLYREAQDFRLKVIERYPHNKIIIFPQSVYYENECLVGKDAEIFSSHGNLLVCARDKMSFDFLQKYFAKTNIKLIPDMAFCMDVSKFYDSSKSEELEQSVYFKRLDKEFSECKNGFLNSLEHRDWVVFEKRHHWSYLLMVIGYRSLKIKSKFTKRGINHILDFIMQNYAKSILIKGGVKILSPFKNIYTSRLHAMILGILMDKNVYGIDSKTPKVREYINTWLYDCEGIGIFEDVAN